MLFNSFNFALFLPIVFLLYWFAANKNFNTQNLLILLASYFFYAFWDWRFLSVLLFSTSFDYVAGIKIGENKNHSYRKIWFWASIFANLGFLGFFKYYNFFIKSFTEAVSTVGIHTNLKTLEIILPLGISFYTFHGLSYIIDVYNEKIKPEKNLITYAVFVSFFPLLIAGPIERATHFLPQINKKRIFDYHKTVDGLKQILWGLFKKIVIADQCAFYVDLIFKDPNSYTGSSHLIVAVFFAIQIYCDFSGYSDIAIGSAKLLGIDLLRNFNYPYFSRDIAEFWRRWHISLSSWFRDYLYIPLGGSKTSKLIKARNILVVFALSGLWHGANWKYIFWGLLNAIYIMPLMISNKNKNNIGIVAAGKYYPSWRESISIIITFGLTVFAWIFFRADNVASAFLYISKIFSKSLFSIPDVRPSFIFFLIALLISIEWLGREKEYAIAKLAYTYPRYVRWPIYYCLITAIIYFSKSNREFIYFQF